MIPLTTKPHLMTSRSRRPGLCFVCIHFPTPTHNPILMLIHNVGNIGMLSVGIQASPSRKWQSFIAMFHRSFGLDTAAVSYHRSLVNHSAELVKITYFFPCLHSYRFIVFIEILPFSLMFDCLSSLVSPCLRSVTISHRQRYLRQKIVWMLSLCSKLTFRVSYVRSLVITLVNNQLISTQMLQSFLPAH